MVSTAGAVKINKVRDEIGSSRFPIWTLVATSSLNLPKIIPRIDLTLSTARYCRFGLRRTVSYLPFPVSLKQMNPIFDCRLRSDRILKICCAYNFSIMGHMITYEQYIGFSTWNMKAATRCEPKSKEYPRRKFRRSIPNFTKKATILILALTTTKLCCLWLPLTENLQV